MNMTPNRHHPLDKQVQRGAAGRGRLERVMTGAPIPYKCIVCGEIEHVSSDRPGLTCRSCGGRIFSKPRNKGHKILDAN